MGDNANALGELKRWLLPPNGLDDCEREALEGGIVLIERLKAENERLTAEVERMTLRWSGERPTVVGEYLVRCKSNGLREENLFIDDDDAGVAWDDDWEFAGPIAVREPRGEEEAK